MITYGAGSREDPRIVVDNPVAVLVESHISEGEPFLQAMSLQLTRHIIGLCFEVQTSLRGYLHRVLSLKRTTVLDYSLACCK